MKNYIIILALVFGFQYAKAQDFQETDKYIAVNKLTTKQQEYGFSLIDIVATNDASNKIATIEIEDFDLFEGLNVTTLSNPNLKNISEVIKVDVEYVACCAHVETYYFLATTDGDYVSLPAIENVYCEDTLASNHYTFPSQTFGKENTILTTKAHYNEAYDIKDIEVLKQMVWDDNYNDFDNSYAVTVTH